MLPQNPMVTMNAPEDLRVVGTPLPNDVAPVPGTAPMAPVLPPVHSTSPKAIHNATDPHRPQHRLEGGRSRDSSLNSQTSKAGKYGKWTTLGPAKSKLTRRATKSKLLIKEVQHTLGNPTAPNFTAHIQDQYRRLSELISKLESADSEALKMVQDNPALSSSSEVCNKNFLALTEHIESHKFKNLTKAMEHLLQQTEDAISANVFAHSHKPIRPVKAEITKSDYNTSVRSSKLDSPHSVLSKSKSSEHPESKDSITSESPRITQDPIHPHQDLSDHPDTYVAPRQQHPKHKAGPTARPGFDQIYTTNPTSVVQNPSTDPTRPFPQSGDLENLLSSILTPFSIQLENLSQHMGQVIRNQIRIDQAQQILVSNFQALQARVEVIQNHMESQEVDESLHSLSNTEDSHKIQTDAPKHAILSGKSHPDDSSPPNQIPMDSTPKSNSPGLSNTPPTPINFSPPSYMGYPFNIASIIQTVKPFDGSADSYALFITRFDSLVHKNPNIDAIMKQNILIGLLDGEAKVLVTSSDLSEEAYSDLRENLEKMYNRQSGRQKELITSFKKLPFHQTDAHQMDKDVMRHLCLSNSLQKRGVAINDPVFIGIFVEKLPSFLMKSVIRKTRRSTFTFLETANLIQDLISDHREVSMAEQAKRKFSD